MVYSIYIAGNPLKYDTECLLNIWQSSYLTQQNRETHYFLLIKQRLYMARTMVRRQK